MKRSILLALLALAAAPGRASDLLPESIVRIAILEKVSSFNLGTGEAVAVDLGSGRKQALSGDAVLLVRPEEGGLAFGDRALGSLVRVLPRGGADFVRVNGRKYRDSVLVQRVSAAQVTVINEMGFEGYIYGILPREVSPEWPLESLKAQAVISRTFALRNLRRHDRDGFDLCNKVHCQVFGGLDAEREQTNRAVDATKNQVVTHGGDLANTVFFANCGGATENPKNAWATDHAPAYLKVVHCRACRGQSHYRWRTRVSGEEVAEALRKAGFGVQEPVESIAVAARGKSGRARSLRIKHGGGALTLRASRFRMALGADRVRSTLFSAIRKSKDGFLFDGRGWGHGVGLCQEGAKVMAAKGSSYKKIVKFYYPGTRVETWED